MSTMEKLPQRSMNPPSLRRCHVYLQVMSPTPLHCHCRCSLSTPFIIHHPPSFPSPIANCNASYLLIVVGMRRLIYPEPPL